MLHGEASLAWPTPVLLERGEGVSEAEDVGFRRMTLVWVATVLALVVVLGTLGWLMRLTQGNLLTLRPEWFYSLMTLHGLGMFGTWYIATMAAVTYLLSRHVRPNLSASRFVYGLTLVAVSLFVIATLVGRFSPGWYFLYPLPFYSQGVWKPWATAVFFTFVGLLGVAWLIWEVSLLGAIARRWSLPQALGWDVLFGRRSVSDVPLAVHIATVMLVLHLSALLSAVVLLSLYTLEGIGTGIRNDPLLMKNLLFYFGHVTAEVTTNLSFMVVLELLPRLAGRPPFRVNRMFAAAFNVILVLIAVTYLHHLLMDFAQPFWLRVLGQTASYLIPIPAAVVTIFIVLTLVYGSRIRWTLPAVLLYLGVMGLAIDGIGAAFISSTPALQFLFHNTLVAVAHLHLGYVMGVVLINLGFVFQFVKELSRAEESPWTAWAIPVLLAIGGYGLVLMFSLAGVASVPRRYAIYPEELARGVTMARFAIVPLALLTAGALLYLWELVRRWPRAWAASRLSSSEAASS